MLLRLKSVRSGYGRVEVLHGIDIEVAAGESVAVLGPNGAGKSVLLKTIAGTLSASDGRIIFAGDDITSLPASERRGLGIALLPQSGMVFPAMTVEENLLMGAYIERDRKKNTEALDRIYQRYSNLVALRKVAAGSLSGGQQKLVGLARSLMSEPKLLLLDEPSIGLDPISLAALGIELRNLAESGLALVIVEQNLRFALGLVRRACFLELGRIGRDEPSDGIANEELLGLYFGKTSPLPRAQPDGSVYVH